MMLWRLKRKLTNIQRRANPDEALKLEMKKFFQDKGYFAKPEPVVSMRHFSVFQFASVALTIVLLVTAGMSSYAYASENVLPDSILYPVKETIENLEERFAVTEAQKKEVLVRHQERRLQEANILLDQQKPLPVLHEALLVEVKKEELQKVEGRETKDEMLPLVKVRLEIEAKEAMLREQRRAERDAQKKLEQEKRAAEKEDRQEERRKEEVEKQRPQEEWREQQKKAQDEPVNSDEEVSQENEAKTEEELKMEAEIKSSDRSDEEKQKLLLERREKGRVERLLRETRRQEAIRARQKEQEAKRHALEEQKRAEREKRELELRIEAEAQLKSQLETERNKALQETAPLDQKVDQ